MIEPERPIVTLHFAQSLDGRIAARSGAARWISGPEATRFAHELRAQSDVVIVGSGTALADDPLLTVRHVSGPSPRRVVLDARGRLPPSAKLVSDRAAPTLVVAAGPAVGSPLPDHVTRWELPAGEGGLGVDLQPLLARLAQEGVKRVLVEGGRRVITSFLRAGLVDRLIICVAPIVIGGGGIEAVADLGAERLDQAPRFVTRDVWRLGDDVLIELGGPPRVGDSPRGR